jgi:molybdopterin-guanine dinucleotide biosynthesis protein A
MGMKSAWSHVQSNYALFIPCDVTYIPNQVLQTLHDTHTKKSTCLDVLNINGDALYPFCLMKEKVAIFATAFTCK